jgi:CHASE2 domain-containing sensor protein
MIEEARASVSALVDKAKDPTSYAWITYAWVVVWSIVGGLVNWHRKIRDGHARPFNLAELVGEVATSAFAGVSTFWLCEWVGVAPLLAAVFIGIAGHMGTRFVFFLEHVLEKHLSHRFGMRDEDKP